MLKRLLPSMLFIVAFMAGGCEASGGGTSGDAFAVRQDADGNAGVYYIPLQGTPYVLAPMALQAGYFARLDMSLKSAYGGDRVPVLPQDGGWISGGSGPWFNAVVYDTKTGQSRLLLDRKAIVWHATRSSQDAKTLLLLVTDNDDNKDGKLGVEDFRALFGYEFETGRLLRITPPDTTVIAANSSRQPSKADAVSGPPAAAAAAPHEVEAKPTLFLTLRVDRNKNGKIEPEEPPMIQMLGNMNTPPVLSADQFEAARNIWQQPLKP